MSNPLSEFIEGACSPARYEPDLALNLEICEMVTKKQGNAPREAAKAIVKLVNSKSLPQSMLALTLLDNCVKNCGYPFHLQISTKEFLNELVRKFPERPAPFPNPVTQRILYLIKEWKVALADTSRHKDDLVHIKDMYRLLRFKGYRFPELRQSSLAALSPSESLKSAQELEEEDRATQAAKLQELIRRGRPQDLVEANQLMKVMTGYDSRSTVNYKEKFEEKLHEVQEKAILLYRMLEKMTPGENLERNETIRELKVSCTTAQPKLQKMISEEEDNDRIEDLLALNDMINNALSKWEDIKKGVYDTEYAMSDKQSAQLSGTEPVQAISLIDLDDNVPDASPAPSVASSKNAMHELSDLFGSSVNIASPATTSASFTASATPPAATPDPFDMLHQPAPVRMNQQAPIFAAAGSPALSTASSKASSTPATSQESILLVNKNGVKIVLEKTSQGSPLCFYAKYSNKSSAPLDNFTLHLSVPKSMDLKMEPATSKTIPSSSNDTVTQRIEMTTPSEESLRLRYKVTYELCGVDMEITGIYP